MDPHAWLVERGFDSFLSIPHGNGSYFSEAASNSSNPFGNQAFFEKLFFSPAKSVRTSTIILSAFNTIAAFTTFAWILWESRRTYKQQPISMRTRRVGILGFVSSPDLYPLILSGGITVQGIVFAAAQSTGLDDFTGRGCTLISQAVFPALLLVPVIQFVLGVEVAIRGMRSTPFPERGRLMVSVCLAIICLITLVNFLVADLIKANDSCFKSLFWFVVTWAEGIFVLLVVFAATLMASAIFVFVKLTRSPKVDPTERVNASRMIFFMALAVLSDTIMCTFFFVVSFMKPPKGQAPYEALTLSMVAAVVANLSGLMTGGLHVFLRSNSISTIGACDKWEKDERMSLKKKIRLRGFASSPDFGDQIMQPVSRPMLGRSSSTANLMAYEKGSESVTPTYPMTPDKPMGTHAVFPLIAAAIQVPQPVQISSIEIPKVHVRKGSDYSLVPKNESHASADMKSIPTLLPSTTYNPDEKKSPTIENDPVDRFSLLKPPPPLRTSGRHIRNSSMMSSATVQIGLRLSNVEDIPSIDAKYLNDGGRVHHLGYPVAIEAAEEGRKGSPLSNIPVVVYDSDDDTVYEGDSTRPQRDPVKDARMKTLPPVPVTGVKQEAEEDQVRLSPTVYTPESSATRAKLPSPRGVGFQSPTPKRSDASGDGEGRSSSGGRSQWI